MIGKIIKIAKQAGIIHRKYYKSGIQVRHKNGDKFDHLTKADIKTDAYIRSEIEQLYPEDDILSEETDEGDIDYSGRVWMVDPLDGTKQFTSETGAFSVMIGLCMNGEPLLGVAYAPVRDELYYAEKEKGAFMVRRNDKVRLQVNTTSELSDVRQIVRIPSGEKRPLDYLVEKLGASKSIREGSIALKFGWIARGDAEVCINTNFRCSKWDTCAPQVILEEAGGKVTDLDGNALDYKQNGLKWKRSFVGTNGILHDSVLSYIRNTNS